MEVLMQKVVEAILLAYMKMLMITVNLLNGYLVNPRKIGVGENLRKMGRPGGCTSWELRDHVLTLPHTISVTANRTPRVKLPTHRLPRSARICGSVHIATHLAHAPRITPPATGRTVTTAHKPRPTPTARHRFPDAQISHTFFIRGGSN